MLKKSLGWSGEQKIGYWASEAQHGKFVLVTTGVFEASARFVMRALDDRMRRH